MTLFLVELIALSALLYFVLGREFKRLAEQYSLKKLFTVKLQAKFVSFQDAMMMVGYSTEQATKSLKGFAQAFDKKG